MKNIHILPTDKPSRLFNCFGKLVIGDYTTIRENLQVTNQHLYITSDEEIKQGDWYLGFETNYSTEPKERWVLYNCVSKPNGDYSKKIILTTDQDLIKDGVQAIDDTFIEWFVKNPSCERVKVEDYGNFYNIRYLILIPKEESKQETLEEVAERYSIGLDTNSAEDFINGAKWQADRMYSEKDLRDAFFCFPDEWRNFDEWFEQFKK